jgi:uncharacterized membrane protein YhaH (DUF805 family)
MKYFKNIVHYYSNFSGKAGRLEYFIYIFFQVIAYVVIFHLYSKTNWLDKTILNLFFIHLTFLVIFIPIQAVTTRRLRDLKINRGLIFINFIPMINMLFKIYLILAKNEEASIAEINLKDIDNIVGQTN